VLDNFCTTVLNFTHLKACPWIVIGWPLGEEPPGHGLKLSVLPPSFTKLRTGPYLSLQGGGTVTQNNLPQAWACGRFDLWEASPDADDRGRSPLPQFKGSASG